LATFAPPDSIAQEIDGSEKLFHMPLALVPAIREEANQLHSGIEQVRVLL
jgi:hypothetical protein